MKLSSYTKSLLDDIERRIDPETEEDFHACGKHSSVTNARILFLTPCVRIAPLLVSS